MKTQLSIPAVLAGLFLVAGCSQEPTPSTTTTSEPASAIDGSQFILNEEPSEAATVIEARENSEDGEDVVLVGRIGGSVNPWVEGRAAFSIVDQSLKACSDIPGDECEIPWDYCCETQKLPTSMAFVKFVGDDGRPLKTDARELLNLQELQTVVVCGKAKRDEVGNLTVLASSLFVRDSSTSRATE